MAEGLLDRAAVVAAIRDFAAFARRRGEERCRRAVAGAMEGLADNLERDRARTAGLRPLRPSVERFARAMEDRLRANDHKGGWSGCSPYYLAERIVEEVAELDGAALVGVRRSPDPAAVRREAADVANFAMMLADVCGGLALPVEKPAPTCTDCGAVLRADEIAAGGRYCSDCDDGSRTADADPAGLPF